jgi:fibronectin-binding autotransporter adhesin
LVIFAVGTAHAANDVLINEYVKAGVNEKTGTFGSGASTPPGLQYDSTGTGNFNDAYDYLTPGTPFDGFTVKLTQTDSTLIKQYMNNNAGYNQIAGGWTGTPSSSSAVWSGATAEFGLTNSYSLLAGKPYIDINTQIEAKSLIPVLYFGRYIDPDAVAVAGDRSVSDNVLGYGAVSAKNVAFAEAITSRYALGLYTSQVTGSYGAGISPSWSTDPIYYLNNTNGVNVVRGDYTIGLGFKVSNLSIGDIVNFRYAYGLGSSAFNAAKSLVDGGAGGGSPGVVPGGGTLKDVGSATSAASETPSTPTITGSTISSGVTSTDTAGTPVATTVTGAPSVTKSGLESITTQLTKVTTYTPITRTTTTTPVTITSYSDGTTSRSTGVPVVTTSDVSTTTVANTTTVLAVAIDSALPVVSGSIAHHTPSDNGAVQTIARETTTTVTTPLTQTRTETTVIDGETTSTRSNTTKSQDVAVSVANDSFSGRIDQYAQLGNL